MKKVILIWLFLFLLICAIIIFTGCKSSSMQKVEEVKTSSNSLFTIIEANYELEFYVVYMNETKVMYTVSMMHSYDGGASGVFTLLVKPDGSPMIYKGK